MDCLTSLFHSIDQFLPDSMGTFGSHNIIKPQETDNYEAQCGNELGGKLKHPNRAWSVKEGSAIKKEYDGNVLPDIEKWLQHHDPGDVGAYIRLYMIGPSKDKAVPVVTLCCRDPVIRKGVKRRIHGPLLKIYPKFGLGSRETPLEERQNATVQCIKPRIDGLSSDGADDEKAGSSN
ncbi:hypothetical protein B0H66DRAFT_528623 [Apodospora peruviana]|uniref:Uncharacterized protein n=1 Tax=Apodospora peruviana TaxID=516989 RepID=A0AAE0IUP3_9PEZI|nr:hypothetical protein B0H66DRAFT_528623 [Apodospora peruviana]